MHAYLDGALGPDGQLEWAAAEKHLEGCEECRERLDEARELRAKAGEILAGAQPAAAAGPGFASLAAEAEQRSRPVGRGASWWRSTARLAWAASLVIAAGAGWIGHELLMQQGPNGPRSSARSQAAETVEAVAERRGRAQPEEAEAGETVGDDETARDVADADVAGDAEADRAAAAPTPAPEADAAEPQAATPEAAAKLMTPQADRQVVGRSREEVAGQSCFAPRAEVRASGLPGPLGVLVLRADGTLRSEAGGQQLVGFWNASPADSLRLRLTDGSGWFVYRLQRSGDELSGVSPEGEEVGFRSAECPP